ncbi:MAG TPA: hypothetical protein VMV72_09420 [Verrucomicrobiae bacterium]|nr:hypothetical protein [Verrucomicrobiae bacterium]
MAQALALPYLVIDSIDPDSGYRMNPSPPYYSSFLFRDIPETGVALLPPVNLMPGLLLAVRVWNSSMKIYQSEGITVSGGSLQIADSADLIHMGGTVRNTNHVNSSTKGDLLRSGFSFVLLSTGSVWMLLNSFAAPGAPT